MVAPTAADARDTMVEGESGILAISSPWCRPEYEPSKKKGKHKGAGKTAEAKQIEGKPEAKKETKKDGVKAKPAQHKPSSGKTTDRTTTAQ